MTWKPEESAPIDYAVLVWDGDEQAVARLKVYPHRRAWWVNNTHGFCEDGEIYNVTHWRPLPEPPK